MIGPETLAYKRSGAGPTLVLLHPVGLDSDSWAAVMSGLQGLDIIAVDLPGHGGSKLNGSATLNDFADRVADLLLNLKVPLATVAGLSCGGMVAQAVALRHPALVEKLVLCGCPATFPDQARPAIASRGERAVADGMQAVIEETLQRWFTPDFIANGGAAPVAARLLADEPETWAATWRAISQLDHKAELSALNVPVLCIAGELDQAVPPVMVKALADCIAGAEYRTLPGAPHMMQLEQPAALVEQLRLFIASDAF
ncbi:alpha/beta fold hydrolase [Devosia riboflavina]|uniref:alpha/beta fold hydrolase n=1 Tax=Devosia riboflavina TaxID=46914 RepID=UPI00068FFBDC|nr:alpha/beta fold hydrolase [Devosia riboflavina]